MKKDCYVYVYIDPRNNEPFYVGYGEREERYLDHLNEAKILFKGNIDNGWLEEFHYNPEKIKLIIDILECEEEPIIIKLLENLTKKEAKEEEIRLIALYGRKDLGTGSLLNKTDGGEGGNTLNGRKAYTDGIIHRFFKEGEQPEGWIKGSSNILSKKQKEAMIKGIKANPRNEESIQKQIENLQYYYYETKEGIERRKEISEEMKIRGKGKGNNFYGKFHNQETKDKISQKNSSINSGCYQKKVYNDGTNEIKCFDGEQPEGWKLGRLESVKNKIGNSNRDKKTYNNGKMEIRCYPGEELEGFIEGRLEENKPKGKKNGMYGKKGRDNPNYGKKTYNNGIIQIRYFPGKEPKGWKLGTLKK